jgi:FkbM family methyltransferase
MPFLRSLADSLWVFRKTFLTRAANTYYGQFGEDAVLMGLIPRQYRNGFFVDVGAYHPRKLSNTYAFYRRGWRGVNVELDPVKVKCFQLARPGDHNVCAAVSDREETLTAYSFSRFGLGSTIDPGVAALSRVAVHEARTVTTRTLDSILDASPFAGRPIDLLSIDVEGKDFAVLRSLSLDRYRPKIIVIESLLETMPEILASDTATYLQANGYRLVGWAKLSLIFRRHDAGFADRD